MKAELCYKKDKATGGNNFTTSIFWCKLCQHEADGSCGKLKCGPPYFKAFLPQEFLNPYVRFLCAMCGGPRSEGGEHVNRGSKLCSYCESRYS